MSEYSHNSFHLHSPEGSKLTIGPVEDTEYKDRPAVVNGWGKFYIPTAVTMQVIGYVTGTPYPCDQLVLMTCEDQKVYGYDGDELHVVANCLDQMGKEGIAYPAFQSYYHGEAFKHMTNEDWEKVRQSPVGKRLDEEHHKLVVSQKSALLRNLRISRQNRGVISSIAASSLTTL
ncbi:US22 family protein [Lumpfish ranavirus]|uniref:US22 family protein n=1 Tax=Lumpfish ranavirus TaxID=2501771 RepID=A0A3T0PNJ2_9VIRU|nr:US22 family protein [Lumpfish ranavirus]